MSRYEPIQLAVNYSLESLALKQAGAIQFDLYKLPDWPDLVSEVCEMHAAYVHFTLSVGKSEPFCPDWALIDRLLEVTGTAFINVHLSAPAEPIHRDIQEVESILSKAIADVMVLIEHYGPERVILENVPIIQAKDRYLLPVVTPTAICQVIESTGCGLLLDLAHARLAARALEIDERDYLQALPVQRLRELHITGIGLHEGDWVDHMELAEDDWDLLDWALDRIRSGEWARPRLASFEYSGIGAPFCWRSSPEVLARQVPELYKRLR
jgi:uncharacterized protein (UPF0276 family)